MLVALGACSPSPEGAAEDTATETQPLYGLGTTATKWPNGVVPVCFQDPAQNPALQTVVKNALNSQWGRAANITFNWLGACPATGKYATIVFQAGMSGAGGTAGVGYGNPVTYLPNDSTVDRLTGVAIHEFGHVLGFAHEMQRPDNWVDGAALQCSVPSTDPYASQYAELTGGVNLTPNYDPNSIMNYCANGGPALSVGDIIGVSSASGYGPRPTCVFQSAATACAAINNQAMEETFTVPSGCPAPWDAWVLQVNHGGVWSNVPNSCPDGQPVGTCGTNTNPNSFTFGTQPPGAVATGAPVGSQQLVRMCGANGNCTAPFNLTIAQCNLFFISPGNNPLQLTQGGDSVAVLLMYGPWVSADQGVNATAQVASNPHSSSVSFSFSPGSSSAGHGYIDFMAHATPSAPVGTYDVSVMGTDITSGVTVTTTFPVEVLACTPTPVSQVCTGGACGMWSLGCGKTTDCGGCATTGDHCSYGVCCPTGYTGNGVGCVSNTPPTCPAAKPYCATLDGCATPFACNRADRGGI